MVTYLKLFKGKLATFSSLVITKSLQVASPTLGCFHNVIFVSPVWLNVGLKVKWKHKVSAMQIQGTKYPQQTRSRIHTHTLSSHINLQGGAKSNPVAFPW